MADEAELLRRVIALETKVEFLLQVLEVSAKFQPAPASMDADVLALAQAGEKIQAIKVYRDKHGVGLREAKDAVEAMVPPPKP